MIKVHSLSFGRRYKVRLYGRAVQYTGAPGQMVRESAYPEDSIKFNFEANESETNLRN